MISISNQEQLIIRNAIESMDKVVNTLAYVVGDKETEYQITSLVSICMNQINNDVCSLNAIFNPKTAENKQ